MAKYLFERQFLLQIAQDADTITFAPLLTGQTIHLTAAAGGQIEITRDVTIDASMLSGRLTIHAAADSRIFYNSHYSPAAITLDNLTLTGGHSLGSGGAIYARGSLTLRNCTITGNQAGGRGGGVFFNGTHLDVDATIFFDNRSGGPTATWAEGGGLYGRVSSGSLTLTDSTIDRNTSQGSKDPAFPQTPFTCDGGGAFLWATNSPVTISETTVTNNEALAGENGRETNVGGIFIRASGSASSIDRLQVVGNEADDDVGGLYLYNTASNVTLTNCNISDNKAQLNGGLNDAAVGAWLRSESSTAVTTLANSTISGNEELPASTVGTNQFGGGGLFIETINGATTKLRNSTVSGNRSEGAGGGVSVRAQNGGAVQIEHCTITNNRADSDGVGGETGGGIFVGSGANVSISNTIAAGNSRGSGTSDHDIDGTVTGSYNLIGDGQGASIPNNGTNKIGFVTTAGAIDPLLTILGDHGGPTQTQAPLVGSPAIDAGDPNFDPNSTTPPLNQDQRGAPFTRKVGTRIDIGAVEYRVAPDPLTLPRVANVTISGSQSVHAPYSFDAHDGSGEQLRTVPVGGADTISITFTEGVNVVADDLKLVGLRTYNIPALASFNHTPGAATATWRFTGWTIADHYAIILRDTVTDVESNALDGEWVNPATLTTGNVAESEFPSGNGTAGGDFQFVFTILAGDLDLNGSVNSTDAQWLFYYMNNYPGQGNQPFSHGDFNGDGLVTTVDVEMFAANWEVAMQGLFLPADLNGDWVVDGLDAAILTNNYNLANPAMWQGDLNNDHVINIQDLDLLFARYGLDLSVVSGVGRD